VQVLGFGSLQTAGPFRESLVINDVRKPLASNFALADAGVAIDAGPQVRFGIIQMKSQNLIQPDHVIEFLHRGVPARWLADIVPSGEEMRCINAKAEPVWKIAFFVNVTQISEFRPKATPLPRGIFQRDPDAESLCGAENLIQAGDDLLEASLAPGSQVRAGMQNQKGQSQVRRELKLLQE
jgi:hypothetical protein